MKGTPRFLLPPSSVSLPWTVPLALGAMVASYLGWTAAREQLELSKPIAAGSVFAAYVSWLWLLEHLARVELLFGPNEVLFRRAGWFGTEVAVRYSELVNVSKGMTWGARTLVLEKGEGQLVVVGTWLETARRIDERLDEVVEEIRKRVLEQPASG